MLLLYLGDDPVQVGVARPVNVEVSAADVVDGLVVDHEGAVRVLECGVRRQDRVVRLHHCGRDLQREDRMNIIIIFLKSENRN